MGTPVGVPFCFYLAAAVIVAAAAAVIGCIAVIATAAEQDQQDDDPAPVATIEAVIITHRNTSEFFLRGNAAYSKIFLCRKSVPNSLPKFFPEQNQICSTLMVLVLPDCPLIGPPVRTTLSPGFRFSAFLAHSIAI